MRIRNVLAIALVSGVALWTSLYAAGRRWGSTREEAESFVAGRRDRP